ncbi:MAG: hypothetical protein QOG83_477 [Alphaproteobacteria bacterium]|nr:hypothetical protein [Alphaproteobacteria bacterium]
MVLVTAPPATDNRRPNVFGGLGLSEAARRSTSDGYQAARKGPA